MTQRTLNVRNDAADYRDLLYRPALINVPAEQPVDSMRRLNVPVLDQGAEGSCTGFGLATVIHYLLRQRPGMPDFTQVSPRMLYECAQTYDEWAGDDYEGASCRGAIKGWSHHGVCSEELWPYKDGDSSEGLTMLNPEREKDANDRPLGAYYRVNKRDLAHMHAALTETSVLYASAETHSGWDRPLIHGSIPFRSDKQGGHAFAIVGYDREGFWIQNSWGTKWGDGGFARIQYNDWLRNGKDVWVCRLGAPVWLDTVE